MIYLKPITVEMIYVSVLQSKLQIRADGGMYWIPVDKSVPKVGSILMESIAELMQSTDCICVQYFAKELNVDAKELSPCIHLLTGQLASDFLVAYRLAQAKEWLACTDLTVTEIAQKCGMKWQSVLTERFKKWEKTSPTAYRRLHRPDNFRELYRWKTED